MQQIIVQGLRLIGNHGVDEAERSVPQPFEIDLVIECAAHEVCTTDDIADTYDYRKACDIASNVVRNRSFKTLEALAHELASQIATDPKVASVEVTVKKLRPLLGHKVAYTAVRHRLGGSGKESSH
jgi:dihydroneopterin aldolase